MTVGLNLTMSDTTDYDRQLQEYEAFWTTRKHEYIIFTLRAYGNVERLIFHKPTRKVTVARSIALERRLIEKMLDAGVTLLDDPPA